MAPSRITFAKRDSWGCFLKLRRVLSAAGGCDPALFSLVPHPKQALGERQVGLTGLYRTIVGHSECLISRGNISFVVTRRAVSSRCTASPCTHNNLTVWHPQESLFKKGILGGGLTSPPLKTLPLKLPPQCQHKKRHQHHNLQHLNIDQERLIPLTHPPRPSSYIFARHLLISFSGI